MQVEGVQMGEGVTAWVRRVSQCWEWEEVRHVWETRERGPGSRPICLSRLDVCATSQPTPLLSVLALRPNRSFWASLSTLLCLSRAKMASTHLRDWGLSTEEVH